ncbi:MAG: hypothetical protein HS124_06015 [Anaerolineales bacterium]|nr:hypothetical protein [Anaerolineales bacterium]
MKRKNASAALLLTGLVALMLGMYTNNVFFSWFAVIAVTLSLIVGGRWMRPRR